MGVLSISLMGVVTMARHHVWVSFACIGIEALVVVFMMREVAAMKKG
jgi:intracellular septation protein A